MASARGWRRSSGKTYRAKAMPHAMKLNAMLISERGERRHQGILPPGPFRSVACVPLGVHRGGCGPVANEWPIHSSD